MRLVHHAQPLLVSFSLKFCDHVEMVSGRVLARIAWARSNKHVVWEWGSGAEQSPSLSPLPPPPPPWRYFHRTSLQVLLWLTLNCSYALCNTTCQMHRTWDECASEKEDAQSERSNLTHAWCKWLYEPWRIIYNHYCTTFTVKPCLFDSLDFFFIHSDVEVQIS